LVDPRNSSNQRSICWRNDYNRCINLPFVYQSTSLEYHELIKDYDVEDNYNPSVLKWADVNYLRIFMYGGA
jgi:hypothetical protein